MNNHRWYISGPISAIDTATQQWNIGQFHTNATMLRKRGYEVAVNPAELIADEGTPWEDYMRACLRLLPTCTALVMLPGWADSRGARLERFVALELGMAVWDVADLLARSDV